MLDVSSLPLSDSEITAVSVGREDVLVELRLWTEEPLVIVFRNVAAVEAFSPVGEEISDCYENPGSSLLARARRREGDQAEAGLMKCFVFRSAAGDEPVLTVVAERAERAHGSELPPT